MRKSRLKDGTNFIGVNVEHFVTLEIYVLALRNHYYRLGDPFPMNLKQPDAVHILKCQLKQYGDDLPLDIDTELEFEGETARIAKLYDQAEEWVKENYPYLMGRDGFMK